MRTFTLSALKKPLLALGIIACSSSLLADTYEVTVTNITKGQIFTPRLAITHTAGKLFSPGSAASSEMIAMAEGGDLTPLTTLLNNNSTFVTDMQVGEGLLMPGESQSVMIEGNPGSQFSLVNMLIPTNDAFIAINAATLPESGSVSWQATVYDAGSESNDELCANIPGPDCGGLGSSPDDAGEGYIYTHPGIQGNGDLESSMFDWNNPAAVIKVSKQ